MKKIIITVYCLLTLSTLKAQIVYADSAMVVPKIEKVITCKSKNILICVDRVDGVLRYRSWTNGRTMKQMPNLTLYNGEEERYGTMGGYTWTFNNMEWTYIVEDVNLCDTAPQCGFFYSLLNNGNLIKKQKLQLIKHR